MDLDLSRITDTLYVSAYPTTDHVPQLKALPVSLMLSLPVRPPHASVRHSAARWMHLPCIDSPVTPIPMLLLWRGVDAALPVMAEGGIVLVHCRYGKHRSVVQACAILIGQGYSPLDAMNLVKEQRPGADPFAWYIESRIRKFAQTWIP
jgi:hypothetical protein